VNLYEDHYRHWNEERKVSQKALLVALANQADLLEQTSHGGMKLAIHEVGSEKLKYRDNSPNVSPRDFLTFLTNAASCREAPTTTKD